MSSHDIPSPLPLPPAGEAALVRARGRSNLRLRLADLPKLVIAALLALAILDLLVGVFLRYVMVEVTDFLDVDPIRFFWVEELGEFSLAWLTLIGAAVGVTTGAHFTLRVLTHRLPAPAQRIITVLNHLLIGGFGLLAAWQAWRLTVLNSVLASPGLEVNLGWLYFSAVVGGALIAFYAFAVALGFVRPSVPEH
jgi:TRAP-type C4-dicarboxylate transport system permease small subunit